MSTFNCPSCNTVLTVTAAAAQSAAPDLLTTDEAAEFLHTSIGTLRFWLNEGTAPPNAKIGRRRMFRRADLEAFVAQKFGSAS